MSPKGSTTQVMNGQIARNPLSGETITFRRTSAETRGEAIELELALRPLGAPAGLPHRHLPTERFELTQGMLCVWIAGRLPQLMRAGDVVEVPSRSWHFIVALRSTRARVSVRPGMRFDELLVRWAALGRGDLGLTTLLRLVPLLREHGCI